MSCDRRASNLEEWNRVRPFVDLPPACCTCLLKAASDDTRCDPCVARDAVAAQGVGE